MSGTTTPNAFPYPVGSDNVDDYPALGQLLAEAIDDKIGLQKSGTQASGTMVAATVKSVAVAFTTAFPAAGPVPDVVCNLAGNQGTLGINANVTASGITRSGFNLLFYRQTATGSLDADWIATNVGNW